MKNKTLVQKDKHSQENLLQKTFNSILVGFLICISYLPFWILFGISDFIYVLLRYVVKYRRKVIFENLTHAFPEKSDKEIQKITNKFYHYFCDLFIETIKGYSASEKLMNKHIAYNKVEQFNQYYNEGRSIIFLGMHYNNWEWGNFAATKCKHDIILLYNPMRGNQAFERFLKKIRTRWGATIVPVNRSSRLVLSFGKTDKPAAIWLGADQTPPPNSKFWTLFLNREAPFFLGPEKIAQFSNQPVFLQVTRRIKRGRYEFDFIPLFDKPKEVEANEIILTYIQKMEEIIREEPAYYLWSHRRWKHERPEGIPLIL